MRDLLEIADSLVASLRSGGRGDPADLSEAVSVALGMRSPTGADRVLATVLAEAVRRIDKAFRSGHDVSGELLALVRGLPAATLESGHRPEEWSTMWNLLNDHAVSHCRASRDQGTRLLAEFSSALRLPRALAGTPAPRAAATPALALGEIPSAPVVLRGFRRFRHADLSGDGRQP